MTAEATSHWLTCTLWIWHTLLSADDTRQRQYSAAKVSLPLLFRYQYQCLTMTAMSNLSISVSVQSNLDNLKDLRHKKVVPDIEVRLYCTVTAMSTFLIAVPVPNSGGHHSYLFLWRTTICALAIVSVVERFYDLDVPIGCCLRPFCFWCCGVSLSKLSLLLMYTTFSFVYTISVGYSACDLCCCVRSLRNPISARCS